MNYGNDPSYADEELTAFTTTATLCEHENGWWQNVNILCFTRRVFVCTDCERIVYDKPRPGVKR